MNQNRLDNLPTAFILAKKRKFATLELRERAV